MYQKSSRSHNGKKSDCNAGDSRDMDSFSGLGRSIEGKMATDSKNSCLENPMDREPGGL